MSLPACPICQSEFTYNDGIQFVCPECAHEWLESDEISQEDGLQVFDAHGTPLADGDDVVLIKDLKVKGSSTVIKQGTRVKSIRLQAGDHNFAGRVDGQAMNLKSEFFKKA
ncbi:MAG: zinc ribbon domain-containing protein YjdM [Alcaligenaceae bacterium]|nr:zinc ribbon domain-containing protein YjdM [Alcaligenaceae bacterium]